jgi:hypothetical protein
LARSLAFLFSGISIAKQGCHGQKIKSAKIKKAKFMLKMCQNIKNFPGLAKISQNRLNNVMFSSTFKDGQPFFFLTNSLNKVKWQPCYKMFVSVLCYVCKGEK